MAEDSQQRILREYDESTGQYGEMTRKVEDLVKGMLRADYIQFHSVTSRVKERESLRKKIARADKVYAALSDLTDIAGIRVITYFEDDVDRVAGRLEREFEIDWDNTIDKREALGPDRFGYRTMQHIAEFGPNRTTLSEYAIFRGLKFEIQTRSILQHAWAEMEHDLGYKSPRTIPEEARRRFSRLAGLLEIADDEFRRLRDDLEEYRRDVPQRIAAEPQAVEINKDSLTAFITGSALVQEIDQDISSSSGVPIEKKWNHLDYPRLMESYVARLSTLRVQTIQDLESKLSEHRRDISAFASRWATEEYPEFIVPGSIFTSGVSVNYLARILAAKTQNVETVKELELLIRGKRDTDPKERARRILETYNAIRGQDS